MILIRRLENEEPVTVGTVRLLDGRVQITGDAGTQDFLKKLPVFVEAGMLDYTDGAEWFNRLTDALRGVYTWAEEAPTQPPQHMRD